MSSKGGHPGGDKDVNWTPGPEPEGVKEHKKVKPCGELKCEELGVSEDDHPVYEFPMSGLKMYWESQQVMDEVQITDVQG